MQIKEVLGATKELTMLDNAHRKLIELEAKAKAKGLH